MESAVVRALLVRGMVAGVLAGLLAFGLAYWIGEPQVDAAIALEETHAHAHGGQSHDEVEVVSRAVQSTAGLATAVLVYGVALGGLAALVFAFLLGRVGALTARATALLVAAGAFLTLHLVPWLKYPANPPGAGEAETLNHRTVLYFGMVALSLLFGVGAVMLARWLAPRWGSWNAGIAAVAVFVAATALAFMLMPVIDEVPAEFPATVLWNFRLAALGIQALLWASFGAVFGFLAERALRPAALAP
ncbi:MAG: CbtA family protein [Mycobacteriaceae bacterium]|nr:CbtA family protein [Mycobacteriaceae bacterium]